MLDVLSFLLSLGSALATAVDKINASKEKRLARRILQIHFLFQTIIDDAKRIFGLIQDAEAGLQEYGERRYTRIIQENLQSQNKRLGELSLQLRDPDAASVVKLQEPHIRDKIVRSAQSKSRSIWFAIERLSYSALSFEDGQLVVSHNRGKVPAFPEFERQLEMVEQLESYSKSISASILNKISLSDLL